jgi:ABC-type antimicrobial peptide transport system permease subunit
MIVKQGLALVAIGVAFGLGGALALTRVLAMILMDVSPTDPATFVLLTAVLTAIALLACYIPARRATRIDPMAALRYE